MRFAVSIIAPPNYIHSEAFREVAETVHYGLLELGHDSILTSRTDHADRRHIILGSNLLAAFPVPLAADSIIYNLEQIFPGSPWLDPKLLELFRQYALWDYSRQNLEQLAKLGITRVQHLPIGYVPQLTRIPASDEDIDVLFVGSINERRKHILLKLRKRGLNVKAAFGVYGTERDRLIARAKIALNLHYYEGKVFEIVRVSYLLANRRFVVSERGNDASEESAFESGVAFADYDGLVDACIAYLGDPQERRRIAEAGLAIMSQRNEAELLRTVIDSQGALNSLDSV
jgi:hypothetical protein